jgi:cytochrome P450
MTADSQALLLQLLDPSNRANPYPAYQRIRDSGPLQLPDMTLNVFSSFADCDDVLRHPSSASDRLKSTAAQREIAAGAEARPIGPPGFLFLDPPDHTRLRRLVSKAFTPRRVEALRPRITELVDSLLDEVAGEPTFDLLEALAFPLPVIVICDLMGVPGGDRDQLKDWSTAASRLLDPDVEGDTLEQGLLSALGLAGYFDQLFEERRRNPQDDLVSGLVAAEEQGDRLTADELRAITVLLFIAGHETTMNLIGNGTYALLRNRDQLALVRDDPEVERSAVEELLRYDGPVHATARVPTEDIEVGGTAVPAGQRMIVALGAANRDPAQFPDPDRLDVTRPDNRHLTFSHGIHFCLGASLARVEGQVAIPRLLQRFPDLELAAEPSYREHLVLRGLTELQVRAG